ncbi:MAG: hypothetical protein AMXMBFR48_17630 [Ignavibacteriales bacterium]
MVTILVILTFALFILADFLILRKQKKVHPAIASEEVFDKSTLIIPANFWVAKNHLWLKEAKEGVYLGIDEFLAKSLGRVKMHALKNAGDIVKKGDPIMKLSFNKGKTLVLKSPVDGTIQNVNTVEGIVHDDIYDKNWAMMLIPETSISSFNSVIRPEKAAKWLKTEFSRFKDFLSFSFNGHPELGLTMMDGGNIMEGVAGQLSEEDLRSFENDFLKM